MNPVRTVINVSDGPAPSRTASAFAQVASTPAFLS